MAPCDVPVGVITGDDVVKLLKHAKDNGYAIPAFNCTSSSTANAVMEAAAKFNSPVMIQASNGGAQFVAGKSIKDKNACAAGSVALAMHVRAMAPYYGIPVIMHSDHCAKKLLPWFDGMLEADETYFAQYGVPLFSSHMLDLSEEPDEENIAICVQYFKKMAPMKMWLEMEIGITGGEEDGVNNEDVDPEKLYTSPEQVYSVYEALSPIGDMFSIAAAFGNVHGVYKPGNVSLQPARLLKHQEYAKEKLGTEEAKPIYLVMHGGSGSTDEEIQTAVSAGVVKMNVDTDTQWSYWDGCRAFVAANHDYLQGQIGNPKGPDAPNKKFYDPRVWIRKAEERYDAWSINNNYISIMSMSMHQGAEFQHILRILNTNVEGKRNVVFGLTKIKGLGRRFADLICKKAEIDVNKRAGELTADEIEKLVAIIQNPRQFKVPLWFLNRQKDFKTGKYSQVFAQNFDAKLRDDIERMKKIRAHRGLRHWWGVRVRGQHTCSTGRRK